MFLVFLFLFLYTHTQTHPTARVMVDLLPLKALKVGQRDGAAQSEIHVSDGGRVLLGGTDEALHVGRQTALFKTTVLGLTDTDVLLRHGEDEFHAFEVGQVTGGDLIRLSFLHLLHDTLYDGTITNASAELIRLDDLLLGVDDFLLLQSE